MLLIPDIISLSDYPRVLDKHDESARGHCGTDPHANRLDAVYNPMRAVSASRVEIIKILTQMHNDRVYIIVFTCTYIQPKDM